MMDEIETECPFCGRINNAHAPTENPTDIPTPGDYSICWKCHKFSVYTDDGVRPPTPEEQAEIDVDPELQGMVNILKNSAGPTRAAETIQAFRQ